MITWSKATTIVKNEDFSRVDGLFSKTKYESYQFRFMGLNVKLKTLQVLIK